MSAPTSNSISRPAAKEIISRRISASGAYSIRGFKLIISSVIPGSSPISAKITASFSDSYAFAAVRGDVAGVPAMTGARR